MSDYLVNLIAVAIILLPTGPPLKEVRYMYVAEVSPDEREKYNAIVVDGNVFYVLKDGSSSDTPVIGRKKRRYSDKFSDEVFIKKEAIRKLRLIENFRKRGCSLDSLIDDWKECISQCILELKEYGNVPPLVVFDAFNLERYGFSRYNYGAEN